MTKTSTLFVLLFISFGLFAQGVSITGKIVDSETLEPLPFAHVFIDQTTIVTVSDINGEYKLEHIEDGDYKLVYSYVGYEVYYKTVTISGSDVRVSARLVPMKSILESVEVKGTKDKEWEKQLQKFEKVFLGDKEFAKDCKILNPWVLDFTYNKWAKEFRAYASDKILIENNALGYMIECNLQGFSFDKKGYKIYGVYKFEEINTLDPKIASKWTRNRKNAYQSSLRYFFKSILDHHETENGFEIYDDKRPTLEGHATNTFSSEINTNVFRADFKDRISPSGRPGYYKIVLGKRIEIHHTTQFSGSKIYRDVTHPISWIELENGSVEVAHNGNIVNTNHVVTYGELNNNRIAAMLPLNYFPGELVVVNYITKRAQAKRLQERSHLHTDKSFYYPGEKLYYKAYLNYINQSVRDSLSKVLYVELINPDNKIVSTQMLKMDSTNSQGNFAFGANLNPGLYYLRSYTNWMRNYGPDAIKSVPIVLMKADSKLIYSGRLPKLTDENILIDYFESKEGELTIGLGLDSAFYDSPTLCSISISPTEWSGLSINSIEGDLFFPEEMPEGTLADFIYDVEQGFGIKGQFIHPKKKKIAVQMSVIRGKMDSLYHFKTDRQGRFSIDDLSFFGKSDFSFQAKDKKGRIIGSTVLVPKTPYEMNLKSLDFRNNIIDTVSLESPIKIAVNEIRKDSAKIVQQTHETESQNLNSNADFVLSETELNKIPNSTNAFDLLISRVPGLQFNGVTGGISLRSIASKTQEPLIIIDGMPINMINEISSNSSVQQKEIQITSSNTDAQLSQQSNNPNRVNNPPSESNNQPVKTQQSSLRNSLSFLTVREISRVEFYNSGDTRYSSPSTNGTVLIFTRKVPLVNNTAKTFDVISVEGFQKPEAFIPSTFNFSDEYTPTLYWNSSFIISQKKINHIVLHQPAKPGNYLVHVEGLTRDGIPVTGYKLITIPKSKSLLSSKAP